MDRETVQTLLDLLNPIYGEIDRQTYDEKVNDNFDAARMERDLSQAIFILENHLRNAQT